MLRKIAFLGAGAMAEALIAGIVKQGTVVPEQVTATNKNNQLQLDQIQAKYNIRVTTDVEETVAFANVIVLAMKPKDALAALSELKPLISKDVLIVSVMAGVSTEYIVEQLGLDVAVVRAMPNTSAMIGYSATALAKGEHATGTDLELAKRIFTTVGMVREVTEEDIHIVTGIAGSGPAYFYYVVEAMEEAAVELGLDPTLAGDFVKQTILGAAQMLQTSTDDPATLRKKVTSPAGTTEQGIKALDDHQVNKAFAQAVKQATKRSITLGEELEK